MTDQVTEQLGETVDELVPSTGSSWSFPGASSRARSHRPSTTS